MSKFENLTPIWDSLPSNISWQIYYRDKENYSLVADRIQNLREGINISIVMNTASMIEGYLEEKIRIILFKQIQSKTLTEFDKRLQNNFIKDLSNATFSKYNELYRVMLGIDLLELLGSSNNELWKDIQYLFKVRNIVAHSQSLQMEIDIDSDSEKAAEVQFIGKFKDIQDYFVERSINPSTFPEGTNFKSMFFNDYVANYFFMKAKLFIICMDQKLKEIGIIEKYILNVILRDYSK